MNKIVVIEDEPVVCNNIVRILKAEKFEAFGAENGVQGVRLAQEEKPDLIICDIMMPGLDGYDVLTTLQKQPETALIPFIFLSAKVSRSDMRQGIELGADDYLTKPFDADELLRAIAARFSKEDRCRKRMALLSQELTNLQKVAEAKDLALSKMEQEFRRPLSNINVAIKMLAKPMPKEQQDRYLQILQSEFERELSMLNQMSQLQKLLTPENVELLSQFNILKND